MRTEGPGGLQALWLYPGLTIAATIFSFFAARVCVWAVFSLLIAVLGRDNILLNRHLAYCSAELAVFSAQLAAAQYLTASSLALAEKDRVISFSLVFFSAAAAGMSFSRLAQGSSLETAPLYALPAAAACLIGGVAGIFQEEGENPMREVKFNPFIRRR